MKFLIFCALFSSSAHAFINIEAIRLERNSGASGSFDFKAEGQSGNTQKFLTELSNLNLYREESWEYILLGKYRYGESRHIKDTHEGNLHARVTKMGVEKFSYEGFLQTEFSEFKRLKRRDVMGIGVRTELARSLGQSLYLGTGTFFEHEMIDEGSSIDDTIRANAYLSYAQKFGNDVTATVTLYYQPSFEEMNDFRMQFDSGVSVPMGIKNLSVTLQYNLQKDSRPPRGVEPMDTKYMAGLSWSY